MVQPQFFILFSSLLRFVSFASPEILSQRTETIVSMTKSVIDSDIPMKNLFQQRTDDAYVRSDLTRIDDAIQMVQLPPHLVDSYLPVDGALHTCPDNPFAMAPSSLQQLKQNLCYVARNALNEAHDRLFTKLSFDILECVFQHLNQRDLLRCAGVNKQWSWFLSGWPYFWKTIRTDVSRGHGQLFESVLYQKRINKLMLHGSSEYYQGFADVLLKLMADTHYSQLTSMHIELMQGVNPQILSRVLYASNANLTILYLDRCAVPPEVVFGTILSDCPLLVELYYKQHTKRGSRYHRCQTNIMHRKRLALRKLMLDLGNEHQQSNTFLPSILQRCTNLQLLFWNPVDHINHDSVIRSLNMHCLHLQWLSTVREEDQENMSRFVNFGKHYIPPKSGQAHRGLTLLDISHNGIMIETSTLEDLLRVHHSTLRTIVLPDVKRQLFRQALTAIQKYPLINLDTATLASAIDCADSPIQSMLFEVLSSWKNLKTVSLSHYNGNTLGILEALVHLKELESVSIIQCSNEAIDDVARALGAWMTDQYKVANIKEFSLDCKVLQYIDPEHLINGFCKLINVHVIHSSTSPMTTPCTCQYSGTMYKFINARKILNHRGGDVYASILE